MIEGFKRGDILYYYNIHTKKNPGNSVSYATFRRRLKVMPLRDAIYIPQSNPAVAKKRKATVKKKMLSRRYERAAKLIEEGITLFPNDDPMKVAFYGPDKKEVQHEKKVVEIPANADITMLKKKKGVVYVKKVEAKKTIWQWIKGLFE